MNRDRVTCWEAFATYPPYYVRLFARQGTRAKYGVSKAISDAELAIASGIEINRIREINYMANWDTMTYAEIIAYTMACNFDPTDGLCRQRAKNYEYACRTRNLTPFLYLRKHPKWESEFLPLIRILKAQSHQPSAA